MSTVKSGKQVKHKIKLLLFSYFLVIITGIGVLTFLKSSFGDDLGSLFKLVLTIFLYIFKKILANLECKCIES